MMLAGERKGGNISWDPLTKEISMAFPVGSLSPSLSSSPFPESLLLFLSSLVPVLSILSFFPINVGSEGCLAEGSRGT